MSSTVSGPLKPGDRDGAVTVSAPAPVLTWIEVMAATGTLTVLASTGVTPAPTAIGVLASWSTTSGPFTETVIWLTSTPAPSNTSSLPETDAKPKTPAKDPNTASEGIDA